VKIRGKEGGVYWQDQLAENGIQDQMEFLRIKFACASEHAANAANRILKE
jgi:hypothetical protein